MLVWGHSYTQYRYQISNSESVIMKLGFTFFASDKSQTKFNKWMNIQINCLIIVNYTYVDFEIMNTWPIMI